MRLLFICSQNRLRSPTAERVVAEFHGVETASAGLNYDAERPVTDDLLAWADIIFVMEKAHRNRLSKHFREQLRGKPVIVLDIPDEFEYMQPELVRLLKTRVLAHLQRRRPHSA